MEDDLATPGVDETGYYEQFVADYAERRALLCEILTDNRNRAAADVRSTLTKHGGSLGEPGSVAYLFEQKGYLLVAGDEDTVMMAALEGGADDVEAAGDQWEVTCAPGDLAAVRAAVEEAGVAAGTLTAEVSISNLAGHKLRSALTMLGMIFGVAAVIAMLAIGAGAVVDAAIAAPFGDDVLAVLEV